MINVSILLVTALVTLLILLYGVFRNGVRIDKFGNKRWYLNGKLYMTEYANGDKYWYQNGKFHRENGPSVEFVNGYKAWYLNGKRHRENGPAVIYANGNKEWWLKDKKIVKFTLQSKCL